MKKFGNIRIKIWITFVVCILGFHQQSIAQFTTEQLQLTGVNYSLYLPGVDGATSNVAISNLGLKTLPATIEFWYKPEATHAEYAGIFYNRTSASLDAGVQYDKWTNNKTLRGVWAANASPVASNEPVVNEWNHVALVISTNGQQTLYINGVSTIGSGGVSTYDWSANTTYIGWDVVQNTRAFNGEVDEVRVWTTERSAQQLEANKYKVLAGNEEGLLAYYNFDDQGAQATDMTGNGYHGVITGGQYKTSNLIDFMAVNRVNLYQKDKFLRAGSVDNAIMVVVVETLNEVNPLKLEKLQLDATATSLLSDLSNVIVYQTSDSIFSTSNKISETGISPSSVEIALTSDVGLIKGKNYFWIAVDLSESAEKEHVVDFKVGEVKISNVPYSPSDTDPEGASVVNSEVFMVYENMPSDTVTITAHSSVEGSNFASFQQNAIMTYNGYQYVTYWNKVSGLSRPVIARKELPDGDWEELELDYTVGASKVSDNHQTISMGICEKDGTIHIAYDHHDVPLNYQRSKVGLAKFPGVFEWSKNSFGTRQDYLVAGSQITPVTYPRFISQPDGDLIYECRLGQSGNGDSYMWEYSGDTHDWVNVGRYIIGTNISQNAYINGVHYDPNGRMHVSWVWRETPDPQTNHDVYYAYSDDDGRTWFNGQGAIVGTAGSNPMTLSSPGLKVVTVGKNRGLINQEAQAVDSKGKIHILQSYIGDAVSNSNNFWGYRIEYGELRHIYQDENNVWQSDVVARSGRNRSEIAVDSKDNVYVVSGDHRIYFAAASGNWKVWTELDISRAGIAQNEGFIDRERLLQENVLSYLYAPASNDGRVMISNYRLISNLSSDADLSAIIIDGDTLVGFSSDVFEYNYKLPVGTVSIPVLEVMKSNENSEVKIEHVTALPGQSTITVTSENMQVESVYKINFVVAESILSNKPNKSVLIYPNPIENYLRIENTDKIITVRIIDLNGKLVEKWQGSSRTVVLKTAHLQSGIYVLEITGENGKQHLQKILK